MAVSVTSLICELQWSLIDWKSMDKAQDGKVKLSMTVTKSMMKQKQIDFQG